MRKRTITTQKVLDECGDEWRPLEDVVAAAVPTVPPGKALRFYETRSKSTGIRVLTEDEKIYSGARHFAMTAVRTLGNSNTLETAVIDGVQVVRRRNRQALKNAGVCPECLRAYDLPEAVANDPLVYREETMGKVIFPSQFNQRRFG